MPLSRHIFQAPTRFYKTGIVFLAWLNGHQSHFTMVGGQQSARSLLHFAEAFRLADAAGLLEQPELAVARMRHLLALHGVDGLRRDAAMRDFSADHRWLSINTATLRGAGTLDTIIEACARHGIRAISPWRDQVAAIGLERTAELVRDARPGAVRLLPRRHVPGDRRRRPPGRARRQPARRRRGEDARRGLPGARRRRPARRARRHGR